MRFDFYGEDFLEKKVLRESEKKIFPLAFSLENRKITPVVFYLN
jgi:hypothetical protein